ncbi:MAG: ABC transporter ATP-binding protein [Clostridia bacterium]|nr:ABC transporter ATP-binding protein [Clostridia bacterium]
MKNLPPPPEKGGLSPAEQQAFTAAGLPAQDVLYACKGDMDESLCYCTSWLWFGADKITVVIGQEEIGPAKKKKSRRLTPEITVERHADFAVADVTEITCERYVSTGRLIFRKDKEIVYAISFSMSCIEAFDRFAKAYASYKEKGVIDLPKEDDKKPGTCKKCGAPCDPDKEYCKKHNKTGATAVRLFGFFGGYVPQIIVIVAIMLLGSAIAVFVPQISTRRLFDDVLADAAGTGSQQALAAVGTLVLSIFGIKVLNTALSSFRQYIQGTIMPSVIYDIKVKIFKAMQRLSVGFYSSKQTGSLMDRVMRDATNIYWFFVDGIPGIITEMTTVIGVLIMMFIMNAKLSLLILVLAPTVFILLFVGEKLWRSMHHKTWVYRSKVSSMVSDNIQGQREIKAFAKEDEEYGRFEKASGAFRDAELKLALTEATVFPLAEVVVLLLTVIVLGIGSLMVARGDSSMTTGTLLSYIVYLQMLTEPFDFLAWVSNWWSRCADSAQRVFEIVDAPAEITEKEDAVSLEDFQGNIEIKDLDFEYEPARPVIKAFNLKIDAGQMLGIVGKTGAGKSTIANLIARLYDPKKGSIKLDGIDLRDIRFDSLRKNIGLVSQDIYLFMGSIADNIRYAKPDATMDEVIAAAKAAAAHDFIMKLPDAYETYVGSGGQKLSGGEKQRISIARTIIQDPKILILDEATAAMDTETERNIQNSLSKLKTGRTTLAIAHRLSTLRDADCLAVIEEGTLIEYGTFAELIEQKGAFYKLYELQNEALKAAGILQDETNDEEDEGEED